MYSIFIYMYSVIYMYYYYYYYYIIIMYDNTACSPMSGCGSMGVVV